MPEPKFRMHKQLAPVVLAAGACLLPGAAQASGYDLLVGSYTQRGGTGVYLYRFDAESGRLDERPRQALALSNPSWLALSRDRRHVYAVNENGTGDADPLGRVSHLSLDPDTAALERRDQASTLGDHPAHATASPDGRYLFVSNYSGGADPGGTLAVLPLAADGSLLPVSQISSYQASGHDRTRQLSAHVHSAVMTPDGRYLMVSDLGGDRVYVYRYDPQADAERPLHAADPAYAALPPGSGPRHLVFDATGRHAYLTLEMAGQVAVLDHDDGHLALREALDLAEPGFAGAQGAGAIHLSADGRYLYAVNRGGDNHLVVFAVASDGGLRRVQRRSVEGRSPREFMIDPSGRWLLVANQDSDRIVVIARDPASGHLGRTVQALAISMPADLKFVAAP